MITFSKVLFPVDFSEQSAAIAPAVRAMADRWGSEVIALHVVSLPGPLLQPLEGAAWSALINNDTFHRAGKMALDRFIAQNFRGMLVKPALAEGDIAHCIVELALTEHASLIMMPTHGYGLFRALLLGSITAKVLHDSVCPVWTGVHADQFILHPPDHWRRMLCAVDSRGQDLVLLKWSAQLAAEQGARLRLVHAVPAADPKSATADPALYKAHFDAAQRRIADLQKRAGTNFEACILGGSVDRVVRKAAIGHEADVVIIGRGATEAPFGRLRDNAYSIIRHSPCPVLSV